MKPHYIIILLFTFLSGFAQELSLETSLDAAVNETSGLLFLNNTLITHNDSANTNQLFEIDTSTGSVTRTVTITNASNGDFGNNTGDRIDLKIYRISISDYFSNASVTADIINFSYSDQTDFTPSPFMTNFDAEGLIHYNNMLYVFSKNWLDGKTNIYELSKTPGTYTISIIDTIVAQGFISGATYNTLNDDILLCGYDFNGAFLIQVNGFSSGLFSNGNVEKTTVNIPANYSQQIEGIIPIDANEYYISAEENSPNASGLFSYNISTLSVSAYDQADYISFYPNPAKDSITLSHEDCETYIYAITGQLVKTSNKKQIDISNLTTGIYLVKIESWDNLIFTTKRLIIQ